MARIRTIKPEFPQSESMGRVSRDARLCFILLWTIADDSGRLRGNSRMLASLLFPYDDDAKKHIESWLGELKAEGCIHRYEYQGTNYIQLMNWQAHQKIDKPSASKIPDYKGCEPASDTSIEHSRTFASLREHSCEDQGRDQGREKERIKEGTYSAEPQSDSTPLIPSVIDLPLVDKTEFAITGDQVDEWAAAYPAVDVMQELRKMRQWCIANPRKGKTRKGVLRFVTQWLASQQDKGGSLRGVKDTPTAYRRDLSFEERSAEAARLVFGFDDKTEIMEIEND